MIKKISLVAGASLFVPFLAFAQNTDAFSIIYVIQRIFGYLIPLAITLGVIYFIWGVVKYIMSAGDEEKAGARGIMINGLIGLFVIVSIWGILGIVSRTFGVGNGGNAARAIPCVIPGTTGDPNQPC